MRTRTLAALAATTLALTACGGTNNDADPTSAPAPASASASPTPTAMTNTGHWTGELNGIKADANTAATAPTAVQTAWTALGHPDQKVLAVDLDNRAGSTDADLTGAQFITEDGNVITYDLLSTTLETSDANLDTDTTNQIIDVHNEYSGDDYAVPAGARQTLVLVAPEDLPEKITRATLNTSAGDIPLTPTDDGTAPTAPEPSAAAVEPTPAATPETVETAEPTDDTEATADPEPQQTYDNPDPYGTADGTDGTQVTSRAEEDAEPNSDQDVDPEQEKAICRAADPETATSGTRQYCWTVYGISIG